MALYTFLCSVTLMIILSSDGCHSVQPRKHPVTNNSSACGVWKEGRGHVPWQVVIMIDGRVRCLGNLISDRVVLTDAHCKLGPGHQTEVSLGRMEEKRTVVNASCCMPTPHSLLSRDGICALTLSRPVNFTDSIYPVCLASADSYFYSFMGASVSTGSKPKTQAKVPVVGSSRCKCTYPGLKSHMICAGYEEKSDTSDGCLDNLGGGLWVPHNGHWTLIGVTRFDQNCPTVESLRLYTSVGSCMKFIKEATEDHPPGVQSIRPEGRDPDEYFECPKPKSCCQENKEGASVFDGGVSMGPSSLFVLLGVLVLTYYGVN